MKTVRFKTLQICSNGSSFFAYSTTFKNSTQFSFYKKDYLQLSSTKKQTNTNIKIKSLNNYKKKYLI